MPSANGIRQKIVDIIIGNNDPNNQYSNIVSHSQLVSDKGLCELTGDKIIIKSPVDITVVDGSGAIVLGVDGDGNTHYEIPGASFEIMGGHKYVYLPSDMGDQYNIVLKGTGTGMFTLIDQKIEGSQMVSAEIFNDIPVTPEFRGILAVGGAEAQIKPDGGTVIEPTSEVAGGAAGDIVPPQTTATTTGEIGAEGYYRGDVAVNLNTQDLSQDGSEPAGVFSINYRLDGGAPVVAESASITVNIGGEGKHTVEFFATDKLGNKEVVQRINFVIDKTSPEIKFNFDQIKKDLVFSAVDNVSEPSDIIITDTGDTVTAADQAGNTAQIKFSEKDRARSLRAQLTSLSYNGKTFDMGGNRLSFSWFYGYTPKIPSVIAGLQTLPVIPLILPKPGALTFLLQQARIKDGTLVAAIYAGGKTKVIEYKNRKANVKIFTGLKAIDFATEKGGIKWSY
jgi:hypothetical protein